MTDTMRAALAFYPDDANWRQNGPLDPNSANFTGGPARAALAAAPQPAPEALEGPPHDALTVALFKDAEGALTSYQCVKIAEKLLARGLRLPSQPETNNVQNPHTAAVHIHTAECDLLDTQIAAQDCIIKRLEADRASETMAWAVVDESGITSSFAVYPHDAFSQSQRMANLAEGRVVRVAIRVVEGGDDAA